MANAFQGSFSFSNNTRAHLYLLLCLFMYILTFNPFLIFEIEKFSLYEHNYGMVHASLFTA